MAARSLIGLLACCACLMMASLPSATAAAAAANGNRKLLNPMPDINAAFAAAQARAAATSATINQGPTYINNNKNDDCKHGCNDNDDHPSYSACQSAAAAYASGTAVSSGRGGFAFSNAEAFANAKSASFGSDEWKNNFINACSSTAYAKSTSIATSGKK